MELVWLTELQNHRPADSLKQRLFVRSLQKNCKQLTTETVKERCAAF